MIDLSSLYLDNFYFCTSTLHVRPLFAGYKHEDFTVHYILELFEVRQSSAHRMVPIKPKAHRYVRVSKEDKIIPLIKGHLHGLSMRVDLTVFTGFQVTHVISSGQKDFLEENGLPKDSYLFSIQEKAIDSIRLIEQKDGPLILNWFYLSDGIKKHLFNK